jgi:hypothetical protein
MQGLGQNLQSAKASLMPGPNTPPPGSAAPNENVGGPGSAFAGPVAPAGMGANVGTPGSAYAGPVAPGQQQQPAPGQLPLSGIADFFRNMPPLMQLDWLKRTAGQPIIPQGMPGSAALGSAGLLPPTMNNPSQYGGG